MDYNFISPMIIHKLPLPKNVKSKKHRIIYSNDYDDFDNELVKVNKFLNRISRSHKNFIYNDNLDDYINDKNGYKYNHF